MIDYLVGISFGDFDGKITSSSQWNSDHSVKGCKLNKMGENGHASAWCAAGDDMKNPWIQVDLGSQYWINAVSLQGRGDDDYPQWVTQFRIKYSLTDENNLRNLDVFEGNKDNKTVVKRYFKEPILARIIRLYVLGYSQHPSLRWELHYVMDKKYDTNNISTQTIKDGQTPY